MSDVTFDGLGHTITVTSGSVINNYSGLFQSLQSCKIRNLNVTGSIIYSGYLQIGIGMLAGYANKTTFEYCHSSGSLQIMRVIISRKNTAPSAVWSDVHLIVPLQHAATMQKSLTP